MKNVDLHIHSNYSDGLLSPKELVKKAKENGIKHIALTDHNTVLGLKEAITSGRKINIDVIPGVEILSEWGEVLGYYIDYENEELLKFLNNIQKEIDTAARECISQLNKLNLKINYEDVKKEFPKYPMMCFFIAQFLVRKNIIKNTSELHDKYINKKFKLKLDLPKTVDVIKIIKNSGGVAILAHPFAESNFKQESENIKQLVSAGLDGIEIENGQYKEYDRKIKDKILELSNKYDLILTSGSDFHGDNVESNLGDSLCDEEILKKIKKRASSENI